MTPPGPRCTLGPSAIAAAAIAVGNAALGSPPLLLVDDPKLGQFVDVPKSGGMPIDLLDDGEAELGIGTFPGNFVIGPGPVVVGLNGGVGFGNATVTDLAPVNQPIPSQDAFLGGQASLVFWDDIDDKDGDTFFLELEGHPELSDRLIVQWNYFNFDGNGSTLKFQVQVLPNFEETGIYAQYVYRIEGPATGAGASATIGYQDGAAGFGDVQFSFNTPGAVTDGTVLSLIIPDSTICPGDVDGDCRTGVSDFLLLLEMWGACAECTACPADLDGDCTVGITDLLLLLANWS